MCVCDSARFVYVRDIVSSLYSLVIASKIVYLIEPSLIRVFQSEIEVALASCVAIGTACIAPIWLRHIRALLPLGILSGRLACLLLSLLLLHRVIELRLHHGELAWLQR